MAAAVEGAQGSAEHNRQQQPGLRHMHHHHRHHNRHHHLTPPTHAGCRSNDGAVGGSSASSSRRSSTSGVAAAAAAAAASAAETAAAGSGSADALSAVLSAAARQVPCGLGPVPLHSLSEYSLYRTFFDVRSLVVAGELVPVLRTTSTRTQFWDPSAAGPQVCGSSSGAAAGGVGGSRQQQQQQQVSGASSPPSCGWRLGRLELETDVVVALSGLHPAANGGSPQAMFDALLNMWRTAADSRAVATAGGGGTEDGGGSSMLADAETVTLPYAVLTVQLSAVECAASSSNINSIIGTGAQQQQKQQQRHNQPAWLTACCADGLLTEVYDFDLHLHGLAALLPDKVRAVPYWVDDPFKAVVAAAESALPGSPGQVGCRPSSAAASSMAQGGAHSTTSGSRGRSGRHGSRQQHLVAPPPAAPSAYTPAVQAGSATSKQLSPAHLLHHGPRLGLPVHSPFPATATASADAATASIACSPGPAPHQRDWLSRLVLSTPLSRSGGDAAAASQRLVGTIDGSGKKQEDVHTDKQKQQKQQQPLHKGADNAATARAEVVAPPPAAGTVGLDAVLGWPLQLVRRLSQRHAAELRLELLEASAGMRSERILLLWLHMAVVMGATAAAVLGFAASHHHMHSGRHGPPPPPSPFAPVAPAQPQGPIAVVRGLLTSRAGPLLWTAFSGVGSFGTWEMADDNGNHDGRQLRGAWLHVTVATALLLLVGSVIVAGHALVAFVLRAAEPRPAARDSAARGGSLLAVRRDDIAGCVLLQAVVIAILSLTLLLNIGDMIAALTPFRTEPLPPP